MPYLLDCCLRNMVATYIIQEKPPRIIKETKQLAKKAT